MEENALAGMPPESVAMEPQAGSVSMVVDEALYPLDALYGTAYVFIDRAYVLLDRVPGRGVRVTLATKSGEASADALRSLVGEFANELLSCAWRHEIVNQNRAVIEAVTTQALAGALGPPSLEDLEKLDFSDEGFEDPLGIAVSWEEKYGQKADGLARGTEPAGGREDAAPPVPGGEGER